MEDTTLIEPQTEQQEPAQQDPPSKKLYDGLVSEKLYSKSYDEFKKKYSTPEAISNLHKGLVEEKLYSKGGDDFVSQYFPEIKKNVQQAAPVTAQPSNSQPSATPSVSTEKDPEPTGSLNDILNFKTALHNHSQYLPEVPQPTGTNEREGFKREDIFGKRKQSTFTPKFVGSTALDDEIKYYEQKDKNEKGNLGSYLLNKVTDAVGGVSNAAFDAILQAEMKIAPGMKGDMTDQEALKKVREEVEPTIRSGTTQLVGANISPEKQKEFDSHFVTSSLGALASMVPAMGAPKGAGFVLQAYDGGLQSINNSEAGKDLPESTKTIFATGVGVATGLLMKLNLDKIFGKQTDKYAADLASKTFADLAQNSKEPITADMFNAALEKSAQSLKDKVIATGGKIGKAAATGALFGAATEATNIAAEKMLNKATDKEVFEPKTWGEEFARVLHSGATMAFGGGILGAAHLPFEQTRNFVSEKMAEAKTPEDVQAIKDQLVSKVTDPEKQQEYAQKVDGLINEYANLYSKIPPTANNKPQVAEAIKERDDLTQHIDEKMQELQTVDPAFHEPIIQEINGAKGRAEEMNQQIVEKAQEPQEKPQEQEQNESTTAENGEPVQEATEQQKGQEAESGIPASTEPIGQGESKPANAVLKGENAWDKEGMTKSEYEAIYGKEGDVPYVEVKPKLAVEPEKPISEMNSEELYDYAQKVKAELKKNPDENLIDNVAELKDTSTAVNYVENAENIDELAKSIKSAVVRMDRENPSDHSLAILNAAKKKTIELGIEPKELIAEVLKKTANDFADKNDAEFAMQNVLEKLTNTKPNETAKQNKISDTPKEESNTESMVDKPIGETDEGGGKEPPKVEEPAKESEANKFKDKGILNRLFSAEKIPEHAKKGFEEKGLKYEPQTSEEAHAIGKAMVEQYGIDDAVTLAETAKFKGGVNSSIFAESLNRLFKEEQDAKTPEAKLDAAKRFADVGIRYDEFARGQGRDIQQIAHFYKKSPLGIKIMEETRRREQFIDFAKKKDQSWKEFFDEMTKDPEFEKEFKGKVSEELKKERAEARAKRIKKVDDIFDAAIKKLKNGGAAFSSFIPISPKVLATALEGMKKAYHAGEKVAKLVEDAVDYITKEVGSGWDKEAFKKEWSDKLGEHEAKIELPQEKREKILERFRKKLKGLTEKEKDEVIRKSFKKLVENGALEYDDFKKIIADTLGYGDMTPEQAKKIVDLVGQINGVEDLAVKARESDRSEKALKEYQIARKNAEKAATELGKIVFNKIDIVKRLLSVMQLNTLGIASLVNNPIFNVFNQATVRLPRSAIMTAMDYSAYGIGKLFGKEIKPENNIVLAQREFYNKLAQGSKQSVEQLFTGLTNKDYFQKEVYASQIHPATSAKELWGHFVTGDTKLTKLQIADKAIQAAPFMGVPAEIIARVLNIGDKPQRFATEGAQATTFAHNLGLQGIDYKLFMEFPKEEAYRKFKKDGLSDETAMKKAEDVQKRIINEGEESTFQQDNLLNDAITAAFKPFGKAGDVVKTFNMPFVKIPLNAFWSVFNLANPEVALMQSMVYGAKAFKTKSPIDIQNSKKWFAHAVTGFAWMAATAALAKSGIVNPANDSNSTKKEREGEQNYEQQNSINVSKLQAYLSGENPDDVKNGLLIDQKWFGNMGILMGYQASKLEKMTPEQRKNGIGFVEDMGINLKESALDFMDKGVFSNSGALFTAIDKGGPFMDAYLLNLMNMGTNLVQPAAFAQISKAQLPYYSKVKADSFEEEVKNSLLSRSSILRKVTDQLPSAKVGIWGDKIEKEDTNAGVIMRLFGTSRSNEDNFAEPIYKDYKKTNDTRFFPSAVKPEIKVGDETIKLNVKESDQLATLVGQARKQVVAPYINDMATFEGSKGKRYSQLSEDEKIDKLKILYDMGFKKGEQQFLEVHPEYKSKERTPKQQDKIEEKKDENEDLRDAAKNRLKIKD